jgi:hypothetical protein
VQSYSTAYDDGGAAQPITFTVPQAYTPPPQAPRFAPQSLQARIYGGEVQVRLS